MGESYDGWDDERGIGEPIDDHGPFTEAYPPQSTWPPRGPQYSGPPRSPQYPMGPPRRSRPPRITPEDMRRAKNRSRAGGMVLVLVGLPGVVAGVGGFDYVFNQGANLGRVGRELEHLESHPGHAAISPLDATPSATPDFTEATPSPTASPTASPTHVPKKKKHHAKVPVVPHVPKAEAPLIVLDPGHDGHTHSTIDPRTGLEDQGYASSTPEMGEVYQVSVAVRDALRADGYRVLMTKDSATDTVNFRKRAGLAIKNRAALEVSIHDDHGQGKKFQAVYEQFVGGERGRPGHEAVCENSEVAAKSLRYARIIAKARTEAQGHEVTVRHNNFDNRTGLEPGNLSIIQVFACQGDKDGKHAVPEVYNEMGALTNGNVNNPAPQKALKAYAKGLIKGIEAAIPIEGKAQPLHTIR